VDVLVKISAKFVVVDGNFSEVSTFPAFEQFPRTADVFTVLEISGGVFSESELISELTVL
jgi:hypothetical protein